MNDQRRGEPRTAEPPDDAENTRIIGCLSDHEAKIGGVKLAVRNRRGLDLVPQLAIFWIDRSIARLGAGAVSWRDPAPGDVRHFRMNPSRKPAGTVALPRPRLKARKRSQIAWVSTLQQGRAVLAALISAAQGVR